MTENEDFNDMSKDELIVQLQSVKASQSGVDKKYAELTKVNESLTKERDDLKGAAGDESKLTQQQSETLAEYAGRLAVEARVLARQQEAWGIAVDNGIAPAIGIKLVGDETEDTLNNILQVKQAIDDGIEAGMNTALVNNGTVPRSGDPGGAMTRDEINRMTKAEVARMPDDLVNEVMGATE